MKIVTALAKAFLSLAYWIGVLFIVYGATAGDHYPGPREPTFWESWGKAGVIVGISILVLAGVIYLLDRRKTS